MRGLTFDDVAAMAAKLPGVEEYVWYRTRALRTGKTSFARLKEDGESLVLLVDGDDAKEMVLASDPRVFFTTPHYDGYPYVLVRLAEATRRDLAPLIAAIAEIAARKKPPRGTSSSRDTGARQPAAKQPAAKKEAKPAARKAAVKEPKPGKVPQADADAPFARVHAIVRRIPRGKVTTYGWISKAIDGRLTPVGVGWALRAAPPALPWFRVVNGQGGISTDKEHHGLQRSMLEAEGVKLGNDGRVDLERYGWSPR